MRLRGSSRLVKKLESALKTTGHHPNKTRFSSCLSLPKARRFSLELSRSERRREAYGLEDPAGVYHRISRRRTLAAQGILGGREPDRAESDPGSAAAE